MFWTLVLGIATGLRTMTAIAVVCWCAYAGILPVEGTWAFWTARLVSPLVFTVLALGEYVGDTLPRTPSRTVVMQVAGRLFFGVLVGVVMATALHQPIAGGLILGALGVMIGTYGGHAVRVRCSAWLGKDWPVGLVESAVAVGMSVLAAQHIHREIVLFHGQ